MNTPFTIDDPFTEREVKNLEIPTFDTPFHQATVADVRRMPDFQRSDLKMVPLIAVQQKAVRNFVGLYPTDADEQQYRTQPPVAEVHDESVLADPAGTLAFAERDTTRLRQQLRDLFTTLQLADGHDPRLEQELYLMDFRLSVIPTLLCGDVYHLNVHSLRRDARKRVRNATDKIWGNTLVEYTALMKKHS